MKSIFKLIIMFVVMCLTTNVYAQILYNGKEETIVHVPLEKDSTFPAKITLSVRGNANCCYKWTTTNGTILGDATKQTVNVKPTSDEILYTVTRACIDKEEKFEVTVVCEDYEIIQIESRYDCYNAGDKISVTDYRIKTNPPEYERYVKPNEAVYKGTGDEGYSLVQIIFSKTHGSPQQKSAGYVKVIDSEQKTEGETTFGIPSLKDGQGFPDEQQLSMEKLIKAIEKKSKAPVDLLKKNVNALLPKGSKNPCADKAKSRYYVSIERESKHLCCRGKENAEEKEMMDYKAVLKDTIGNACNTDSSYINVTGAKLGIPGNGLKFRLIVSIDASIVVDAMYTNTCPKTKIWKNYIGEIKITGRLTPINFSKAGYLSTRTSVSGRGTFSGQASVYPKETFQLLSQCAQAKMKFTGLTTSLDYIYAEPVLIPEKCWKDPDLKSKY